MTDKTHAERVACAVRPEYRVVALLHDSVEDGILSVADAANSLTGGVFRALRLLTRSGDETYAQYIDRIAEATGWEGECAREIKLADLKDNMNRPEGQPSESLKMRYRRALTILKSSTTKEIT